MFNTTGKVGGTLERVRITKPDGRVIDHYPRRKNKIVNTGLVFLLQGIIKPPTYYPSYGGDGEQYQLFYNTNGADRGGLVQCRVGNGTRPTSYKDTDMESPLYTTATRVTTSGTNGTGSGVRFITDGTVVTQEMIVGHQFTAAPAAYSLSEVGYFGRINSVDRMFSHLVLEEPIEVGEGDIVNTYYFFRASKDCAVTFGTSNGINFAMRPMASNILSQNAPVPGWQNSFPNNNLTSPFFSYSTQSTHSYAETWTYGGSSFSNYGKLRSHFGTSSSWPGVQGGLYTSDKEFPSTPFHIRDPWGTPNVLTGGVNGEKAFVTRSYTDKSTTSYYSIDYNGNTGASNIYAAIVHGLMIKFGKMVGDTWVPEPITKTTSNSLKFEFSSTITRE